MGVEDGLFEYFHKLGQAFEGACSRLGDMTLLDSCMSPSATCSIIVITPSFLIKHLIAKTKFVGLKHADQEIDGDGDVNCTKWMKYVYSCAILF